ncbi:MAG: leucine-rich repeat domain-containing protein [Promethearchaeota archaeon]
MNSYHVIFRGKNISIQDKTLRLNGRYIKDMKEIIGLEFLNELRILNLLDNQISQIHSLENLDKLKYLDLSYNNITEIKGLDNLINLEYLNLNDNKITEIKGLDGLKNLRELKLSRNKITEIKGLGALKNLKKIDLTHNLLKEEERKLLNQDISVILKYCIEKSKRIQEREILLEKGKKYYNGKEFQKAINTFKKLHELIPNDVNILMYLGSASGKVGNYQDSINYFNIILDINPNFHAAWFNLGITFEKMKSYKEALQCFNACYKIDPMDYISYKNIERLEQIIKDKTRNQDVKQESKRIDYDLNTKDPYELLNNIGKRLTLNYNISRQTKFSEIHEIWRVLIRFLHPDQNPFVNDEITKKVNDAYHQIKKEKKGN